MAKARGFKELRRLIDERQNQPDDTELSEPKKRKVINRKPLHVENNVHLRVPLESDSMKFFSGNDPENHLCCDCWRSGKMLQHVEKGKVIFLNIYFIDISPALLGKKHVFKVETCEITMDDGEVFTEINAFFQQHQNDSAEKEMKFPFMPEEGIAIRRTNQVVAFRPRKPRN